MSKKIAIIGTVGLPAKYGGFETLTEYLTKYLCEKYDITVFCSTKSYETKIESHNGAKLRYIDLNANGVQSIPYDIISTAKALTFADTLLILGVSGCIVLPLVRAFSNKRIIVNIDGLEWKRDKWGNGAKWFLKLSEKLAVKYSDAVVSDNMVIQEYVKAEYGKESSLIAYGADHVEKVEIARSTRERFEFIGDRYAFKVCRIEPENNVHMILEAFKDIKKMFLVIVGNWQNSEYGKTLLEQYSSCEHIYLLDPIYDQNLLNQLRSNCAIYVHGHSAGGTNPSLVEAMYLGLPIIAYGVAYNRETTNHRALYFNDSKELEKIVLGIENDEVMALGTAMHQYAKEHYTWSNIASKYANLFLETPGT